jgi:glutaredoxin
MGTSQDSGATGSIIPKILSTLQLRSLSGAGPHVLWKIISAVILTATIQCYFLSSDVSAEIYQWKDANGNLIYSDSPPSGTNAALKRVRTDKIERPETGEAPLQEQESITPTLRDVSDINAILYMANWCPYCRKARQFLISKGVRLTEYNIERDKGKMEEMRKKSGSNSIPVIDIEGSIIRGYVPGAISSAIEEKRRQVR